jgi:hypothetical protein
VCCAMLCCAALYCTHRQLVEDVVGGLGRQGGLEGRRQPQLRVLGQRRHLHTNAHTRTPQATTSPTAPVIIPMILAPYLVQERLAAPRRRRRRAHALQVPVTDEPRPHRNPGQTSIRPLWPPHWPEVLKSYRRSLSAERLAVPLKARWLRKCAAPYSPTATSPHKRQRPHQRVGPDGWSWAGGTTTHQPQTCSPPRQRGPRPWPAKPERCSVNKRPRDGPGRFVVWH